MKRTLIAAIFFSFVLGTMISCTSDDVQPKTPPTFGDDPKPPKEGGTGGG